MGGQDELDQALSVMPALPLGVVGARGGCEQVEQRAWAGGGAQVGGAGREAVDAPGAQRTGPTR